MKPIFSRNDDVDKIAFLNWRMSRDDGMRNLLQLAQGFMESAIRSAKLCLIYNNNKKADILIFPILANTNHGIELYLKAITWMLNSFMKSNSRVEGGHNIKQIFNGVKAKIKIYGGKISIEEFNSAMEELENYITELFEKIDSSDRKDNMDFSRYPFKTNYEPHFYVEKLGNVEVDLENFVDRFEKIYWSLYNLSDFIFHNELEDEG